MAIDLIDGNTTRYFSVPDHADLTFPDADWFLAMWTRVDDNAGGAFQYLFSNNGFQVANSLNIFLAEASESIQPNSWHAATDTLNPNSAPAVPGADGKDRLIVSQRVSGNVEMWFCEPMATATRVINAAYSDGAINGGVWNIGRRVDGDANRYYEEHYGDVIKGSGSLIQAQIELLARGVPPTLVTDPANLDVWFQFRENAATVVDVINGHIATRQGTGLLTSEHFPVISADIILINPTVVVGGARPQGPFGHPFHGPFAGPIG